MEGHLPQWLPTGFGLVGAWSGSSHEAWAIWANAECREVRISFSGSATDKSAGSRLGLWTVTVDAADQCGNAVLGLGRCLGYEAPTSPGIVGIQAMGLERIVVDRI